MGNSAWSHRPYSSRGGGRSRRYRSCQQQVHEQQTTIAELRAQLERLNATNAELRARLAKVETLVVSAVRRK